MSKRIRIFFVGCPRLDVAATSQLLLSQNTVQSAVQFEIYHFWIFLIKSSGSLKGWMRRFQVLYGRSPLPFSRNVERRHLAAIDYREAPSFKGSLHKETWFWICQETLKAYDSWFKESANQYDVIDCPTIIVTETPIHGGYISFTRQPIGIVSTAVGSPFSNLSRHLTIYCSLLSG